MPRQNSWDQKETDYLLENSKTMTYAEIAAKLGRTPSSVKSRASVLKINNRFRFTDEQIEVLREKYPTTLAEDLAKDFGCTVGAVHQKAQKLGLKKDQAWIVENARQNLLKFGHRATFTQFRKGQTPANKGLRRPGYAPGRMRETQFKKGQTARNKVPVGTTVIDSEGYKKIKIAEPNKWQFYSRYLWEKHHGTIPPNHAIFYRDGNRQNVTIENLELITRAELSRRNQAKSLALYPTELRSAVIQLGKLKKEIRNNAKK